MLNKKSLSFLVASALLILPGGIAKAEGIDVQTDGVRVTVGNNNGISVIQSQPNRANVVPNYRLRSKIYRRSYPPIRNNQSWHNTWIKKNTRCDRSGSTYQKTQTSSSGRSVSQTYSSSSTTVCR